MWPRKDAWSKLLIFCTAKTRINKLLTNWTGSQMTKSNLDFSVSLKPRSATNLENSKKPSIYWVDHTVSSMATLETKSMIFAQILPRVLPIKPQLVTNAKRYLMSSRVSLTHMSFISTQACSAWNNRTFLELSSDYFKPLISSSKRAAQ